MAMTAMRIASCSTTANGWAPTMALTTCPASSGVATASTAPTTLSTRKPTSCARWGVAKARMRFTVSHENGRLSCWAIIAWYIEFHAAISMLIELNARTSR